MFLPSPAPALCSWSLPRCSPLLCASRATAMMDAVIRSLCVEASLQPHGKGSDSDEPVARLATRLGQLKLESRGGQWPKKALNAFRVVPSWTSSLGQD